MIFEKDVMISRFLKLKKKKKDHDNKNIENIFQQNFDNTWYEHLEIKTKRTFTHALPN